MKVQEAIDYAEKLKREREARQHTPRSADKQAEARALLQAAGILTPQGQVQEYYRDALA